MQARGTDAIPLAPRPNLDHYRKLAKELAATVRTGDLDAVSNWAASWIERLASLQGDTATPEYLVKGTRLPNKQAIAQEVKGILRNAQDWRLLEKAGEAVLSASQYFLAWLHGFESWPRFVEHLEARQEAASPVAQFESAADAVVTGDEGALRTLLGRNRALIRATSSRDHHATLLHYIAANGHEGFRQRTPDNAVAVARILLEAGAEPDALADMYGHRCTTMQMLVSSVHPFRAGVQERLVELLLDFGADVDGVEKDGSPIMTAFRFHYPAAARTLARRGARIGNIIAAAALGRADLVAELVDAEGNLRPDALAPSGPWPRLSRDPKVHLGFALAWATAFGHAEVVELLLKRGVDPNGQDDDASALHFAAGLGRMELMRLLLRHGAAVETKNSYGGTVLDGTVWYALNDPHAGVDYPAVVRELLAVGARTDSYPDMKAYVDLVLAGRRGGGYPDV